MGQGDKIEWKRFLGIAAPLAAAVGLFTTYSLLLGWLVVLPGSVFLAVYLYRRRRPGFLRTAHGARLGVVFGLLTFGVFVIFLGILVAHDPVGYRHEIESQMKDALAHNPNPQAQQMAQTLFSGSGGVALLTAMGMAVLLVFLLVICGVSGALAVSLVRNRSGP